MKILRFFSYFIGSLLLFVIIATLLLLIGSTWHLSDSRILVDFLQNYNVVHFLNHKMGVTWLPDLPNIYFKDRLDAWDAVVNGFTMFVTMVTFPIFFSLMAFVGLIYCLFYGLYTADWGVMLQVFYLVIAIPLAVIVYVVGPIIIWFAMFFQPITPGFFVVWLFMGLPLLLLSAFCGGASGVIVYRGATVFIYPKG